MVPNVLSIAGSDPSGGAGIQADLKTFAAHGCYGMAVMTSLTAQNTRGVFGVHEIPAAFVAQQIQAVFDDIRVDAVKIGMAGSAETIRGIAELLREFKPQYIVVDPVMVATSGDRLISDEAVDVLKSALIPLATIVTPNMQEAEILGDLDVPVLLKGGHGDGAESIDVLKMDGREIEFSSARIDTKNTHGTGCTLSAAIAANLAKGLELEESCRAAKAYVTNALRYADELDVGQGHGPVQHGWKRDE